MIVAIVVPLLLIGGWLAFGLLAQRAVLFPGRFIPGVELDPRDFDATVEPWTIETAEGAVEAWYLPAFGGAGDAASAEPPPPGPAVIFAHGNGELIDHWLGLLDPYRRMGVAVLLVEYRGYGRSAGVPTQRGITDDFLAAYDRLAALPEIDPDRIVAHGRSIGGGVACALAAERPIKALVLQSTFTSVRAMARRHLYPGSLMRDPFDNLAVLADYAGPVLLMHGRHDTLITPRHSETLHATAHRSELFLVDSNHNDFPIDAPEVWQAIADFLRNHAIVQ